MKRLNHPFIKLSSILSLLIMILTACQVFVDTTPRIIISPSSPFLEPNQTITLTASVRNVEGDVSFNWSATQGVLSPTSGASVQYTSPLATGEYKVTATSTEANLSQTITVKVIESLNATAEPETSLKSSQLNAFSRHRYKLNIPSSLDQDLLYFELQTNDDLTLTVFDDNENVIASSQSPSRFEDEIFESLALDTQAITENTSCRGPCVIVRNTESTYYLKVETKSSSGSYTLFAFDDAYSDDGEANEDCSTALRTVAIVNKVDTLAAIETLDDRDCFPIRENTTIKISTFSSTNIKLNINLQAGTQTFQETLNRGEDTRAFSFTSPVSGILIVSGDDEAGPAASSKYRVEIE